MTEQNRVDLPIEIHFMTIPILGVPQASIQLGPRCQWQVLPGKDAVVAF